MGRTSIEWATDTLNPGLFGCTKVSEACDHCYAMSMSHRLAAMGVAGYTGDEPITVRRSNGVQWTGLVRQEPVSEAIRRVRSFRRPRNGERPRVFVTSMSDVLHESVPVGWTASIVRAMALRSDCDWLLLTKRAHHLPDLARVIADQITDWPANVWVGVTAENQARADERIPFLLRVPAAVRFVSVEPMVSGVDLSRWLGYASTWDRQVGPCGCLEERDPWTRCDSCEERGWEPAANRGLQWVIAGGESGHRARPSHPAWFNTLLEQCEKAGVPFLFKQWGEWTPRGPHPHYPSVENVARVRLSICGCNSSSDQDHAGVPGAYKKHDCDLSHDAWMQRAGKKVAGRLLNGVQYDGLPVSA